MNTRVPPRRSGARRPWYLLTGFLLGIVLGLLYAWWISPVQYVDTPPSSLREDFKDQYRVLVSLSYAVNRDEEQARSRLSLLDSAQKEDKAAVLATSAAQLAAQSQRALAEGRPETESQALGILAAALGQKPDPLPSPSPETTPLNTETPAATAGVDPVINLTPSATTTAPSPTAQAAKPAEGPTTPEPAPSSSGAFMALPSRTPTAAAPPAFRLKSRQLICDPTLGESQLQIEVQDAKGTPLSGIQALIQWDAGQDVFTTGLMPEKGLGYADFKMEPEITYSLHLDSGEETVTGLTPEECQTSRSERYWGSWLLQFQQP